MILQLRSACTRLFSSVRPPSANCLQINITISKLAWVSAQNPLKTICQTDSQKHTRTLPKICLYGITNCRFASVFLDHWIGPVSPPTTLHLHTCTNLVQNGKSLTMLKLITLVMKSLSCKAAFEDVQAPSGPTLSELPQGHVWRGVCGTNCTPTTFIFIILSFMWWNLHLGFSKSVW